MSGHSATHWSGITQMLPTQSTRSPDPATRSGQIPAPGNPGRRLAGRLAAAAAILLALAGCAQPSKTWDDVARQIQIVGCTSRCQETKDRCDADAAFDYAQCQAGYSTAKRDYRWCLAAGNRQCGYPWWSCSENRYGYCTNRYWECYAACRNTPG